MLKILIFFSIIVLFNLMCSDNKKVSEYMLAISFSILCFFISIRYEFGNDYESYRKVFYTISNHEWIESGWDLLNFAFYRTGFFSLIIFLSIVYCITYYLFFRFYSCPFLYWLNFYILLFSPSLLIVNLSMMRNSLAVSAFMASVIVLAHAKSFWGLIVFYATVLLFSFIHTTIIGVSFVPIFYFILKRNDFYLSTFSRVCIFIMYLLIVSFLGAFSNIFSLISLRAFTKYENYIETSFSSNDIGLISILNILTLLFVLFIFNKIDDKKSRFCVFMYIILILFSPLNKNLSYIHRFLQYFYPFEVIAIPFYIYTYYKRNRILGVFLALYVLVPIAYSFVSFFSNTTWMDSLEYRTIFSASTWE